MRPDSPYSVSVGSGQVTLRKRGRTQVHTATIIGHEVRDGREYIYLDRLLLPPGDLTLQDDWGSSGCISTILAAPPGWRCVPVSASAQEESPVGSQPSPQP